MHKLNLQFFAKIKKIDVGGGELYDIYDATALHTSDVVQATGSSTTAIMSQNAVTNALNGKLSTTGGTIPGNILIQNGNPHLGLIDTSGVAAYFQTYDDGSGLKVGFGYGWVNSLKIDGSGNVYLSGNISDGTNSISVANIAKKSDIPSTTENWTFTLEDGSTVTKAVYVK